MFCTCQTLNYLNCNCKLLYYWNVDWRSYQLDKYNSDIKDVNIVHRGIRVKWSEMM